MGFVFNLIVALICIKGQINFLSYKQIVIKKIIKYWNFFKNFIRIQLQICIKKILLGLQCEKNRSFKIKFGKMAQRKKTFRKNISSTEKNVGE